MVDRTKKNGIEGHGCSQTYFYQFHNSRTVVSNSEYVQVCIAYQRFSTVAATLHYLRTIIRLMVIGDLPLEILTEMV